MIDKWLAIQATAPGDGALERVSGADGEPLFRAQQPQPRARPRSGRSRPATRPASTAATGQAIDFLADEVIALDKRNPQIAARLLTALQLLALAGAGPAPARRGSAAPHRRRPATSPPTSATSSTGRSPE